MKYLLILIIIIYSQFLLAQTDSIDFSSFNKYFQVNMGVSYNNIIGEVSKFTKHGGSLDMYFADGINNHFYGFNMNIMLSNKVKEFTIPSGYTHYDSPGTLLTGLFYGQTFENPKKSHFYGSINMSYGWLLHRKRGDDFSGYRGLVPGLHFGRSIKVGKTKFTEYQNTGMYQPKKYSPSIDNNFIDLYIEFKQLLLNNAEGKGSIFVLGLKYKLNKYDISKNMKG